MATTQTLFGMRVLDTCPCGGVTTSDHRQLVFDEIGDVWHRICDNCLRGETPQAVN